MSGSRVSEGNPSGGGKSLSRRGVVHEWVVVYGEVFPSRQLSQQEDVNEYTNKGSRSFKLICRVPIGHTSHSVPETDTRRVTASGVGSHLVRVSRESVINNLPTYPVPFPLRTHEGVFLAKEKGGDLLIQESGDTSRWSLS